MAWHEYRGKSVKDAIDKACESLGSDETFLQIEVIQEATKGFLGLVGHKEALIRVRRRDLLAEVMNAEPLVEPAGESAPEPTESVLEPAPDTGDEEQFQDSGDHKVHQTESARVEPGSPRIQEAKTVLDSLLEKMAMDASVNASVVDGAVYLDIKGDGSGLLIGKKGQTLDALQYLVSKIVNRENGPKERVEVIVDTENYRLRKRETLRDIAERTSQRAIKTLKPISLSPMPANERRIVHMLLAEDKEVYTKSYGEGPMRRIIIYPRRGTTNKRRRR
jgi:spoIIIJ-associated protein